ncbi:MAG TPA: acetyl-CoA C-acetyltransferase [Dongiaceae bacterium]|nr:acetyl-CoA C-acetyltransferase [Dongiaceae bacterium]
MTERVAIVAAKRTPIGKFLGVFSDLRAVDLGRTAIQGALEGSGITPAEVQEVIFGMARQAGAGPNPARQASVLAGIPVEVPAFTVNQACASGLQAILLAADRIRLGEASILVAGGMESMTQVPYLLPRARRGYRMGNEEVIDAMYRDGFLCPLAKQLMGETAETLAKEYGISREEQDRFAARSQNRAQKAREAGRFEDEIVPVRLPGKKSETLVSQDEHPRDDVTWESLSSLAPVFDKAGTITPANSSGITDGAAALLLLAESEVTRRGLKPLAWVEGGVTRALDPKVMGLGPVPAVRALEARTKRSLKDYDLVELNEAFAAQVLAVDRELGFDPERLNVNGGAISLGHPIGASGARIVVTLLHEMARRKAQKGLATLCVSGGLGVAASFLRDA